MEIRCQRSRPRKTAERWHVRINETMGVFGKKKRRKGKGDDALASAAAAPETAVEESPKKRKKKKKVDWVTVIMVAVMVVGALIIAYPTFSDWWNSYHQTRAIASYVSAVEETDQETIDQMFAEAHAYNERLLAKPNRYVMSDAEKIEYESILDLTGTGVIGYIQISSIGVNLPVYHGVAESVLQVAIGHIEGSSLPVGGPSTHAAVSGHRGLPSARLFTDLDKLVEGDTFMLTVLNQTLTYEVDQVRIVEPQDMSDLNIVQDADFVTLITCTPYGINTHRLLVRGHRIANIDGTANIPPEAVQIPNYVAVPAVALPMLFIYLVGALIYYRLRDHGYDRDKVMKELEEMLAEGESAGEAKAEAAAEPEAATEAEAESEGAAEAEPEVATEAAAETEPVPEPEDEVPTEPDAEAESEAESEPEAEVEPEPEAETPAEAEPEAEAELEAAAEAEAEPEAEVEPDDEAPTELDPDPEPEVSTTPETDAIPDFDEEVADE